VFAQNNLGQTVGTDRTTAIGSNETLSVGASRTVSVGTTDTTTVAGTHTVIIAPTPPVATVFPEVPAPLLKPMSPSAVPPTSLEMTEQKITLSNGKDVATITMDGPNVSIKANGSISLTATEGITITGKTIGINAADAITIDGGPVGITSRKDLTLQGGPMVKINC
jgi:type VI secretion system secreted protein VgrG